MVSSASNSWDNNTSYSSSSINNESGGSNNNNNNNEATVHFLGALNEAANEILIESQQQSESSQQAQVRMSLMKLRPLGLTLPITPSLLDLFHRELNNNYYRGNFGEVNPNLINQSPTKVDTGPPEKLKAACFKIDFIRIGTWERTTKHYDDLMAKCYFAKRKLVWEVMINRLKHKIEILWSDIMGIGARFPENAQATLEIELRGRPAFYLEEQPQPRKHTIWKIAPDFTDGQASICRRHFLAFPPGVLDSTYPKLLECEPRLYELSKKGFPSLSSSLYFEPTESGPQDLSFVNFNVRRILPRQLQSVPTVPSPIIATQPYLQESPSPISDQRYTSHSQVYEDPRTASCGQGMSNYADMLAATGQVQDSSNPFRQTAFGQFHNISSLDQGVQDVNFDSIPASKNENQLMGGWDYANCTELNIPSHNQGAQGMDFDLGTLRNIENNLIANWGLVDCNNQIPLPRIDSLNTLLNTMPEHNPYIERDPCLMGGDNAHVIGRQFYPPQHLQQQQQQQLQSLSRVAPLFSLGDQVTQQTWNNLG